jgi:hypothetical protein
MRRESWLTLKVGSSHRRVRHAKVWSHLLREAGEERAPTTRVAEALTATGYPRAGNEQSLAVSVAPWPLSGLSPGAPSCGPSVCTVVLGGMNE